MATETVKTKAPRKPRAAKPAAEARPSGVVRKYGVNVDAVLTRDAKNVLNQAGLTGTFTERDLEGLELDLAWLISIGVVEAIGYEPI